MPRRPKRSSGRRPSQCCWRTLAASPSFAMKFAVVAPNVGAFASPVMLAELASTAETTGWDGFFVWDTIEWEEPQPVCDPWIALAAVAMATRGINFGTLVLSMARRRPWKAAREALTLDGLSGGRLILGVGAGFGDSGFTTFGEAADFNTKSERFDEGLAILDGLVNGPRPFSFEGRRYTVREASFLPQPVAGRVPIWVTTNRALEAPRALRRAARYDGVVGGINIGNARDVREYCQRHHPPRRGPFDVVATGQDEAIPT